MELGSRKAFVVVLAVGVIGTGILVRLLNQVGYSTLGAAVWVVGYGVTVLVLWYGWLRPLDLTGATTSTDPEDQDAANPNGQSETE